MAPATLGATTATPAQSLCEPAICLETAATRCIPGVCGVLASNCCGLITRMCCSVAAACLSIFTGFLLVDSLLDTRKEYVFATRTTCRDDRRAQDGSRWPTISLGIPPAGLGKTCVLAKSASARSEATCSG